MFLWLYVALKNLNMYDIYFSVSYFFYFQIQIETQVQLNLLHKLLDSVASNVFRPVDILLKALFSQPKDLVSDFL